MANDNRTLLTKLVKGREKHQPARNDDQLLGVDSTQKEKDKLRI